MASNSYVTKQIRTKHKDLIQDIAFDFYGKRVATASLDQTVKIWNINDDNEWVFKEELKISPGLSKVAWAHPEFGSLIAVACDCKVSIYEETCYGSGKHMQTGWVKRTPPLSDARAPVTDLKFAPKFLGLQLAICSQNGEVRIYECSDVLSSNVWTLVHPEVRTNMSSCSSCSWSTCFNLPILLALGCDETSTSNSNTSEKLAIFQYSDSTRTYSRIEKPLSPICTEPIRSLAFAPSVGKLYHVLAIASKSLLISTIRVISFNEPIRYQISTVTLDHDAWRVCWNTVGSVLASAGDDRKVRLWKCNYVGTWKCFAEISGDTGILISENFPLNEVLSHRPDFQLSSSQQQQQKQSEESASNSSTNIRFSQSGALNKNKAAAWH